MANNNFKVFAENTTNIKSDTEYSESLERDGGYQPSTIISSETMNTVLRQNSLLTYAIANVIVNKGLAKNDMSPKASVNNIVSNVNDFFDSIAKVTLGLSDLQDNNIPIWDGSKFTSNKPINDNDPKVLGVKENAIKWLPWSDLEVSKATLAFNATKLENFKNNSSGTAVKFTFGSGSNITTFEHNVTLPTTIENSNNVTTKIAGNLISTIFETNGTTVKKATLSDSSTNLVGGSLGSIPYQSASGKTAFLNVPSENKNWILKCLNDGRVFWTDEAGLKVSRAVIADGAETLKMLNYKIGSIPYKNNNDVYDVITPPNSTSTDEEFMLITKYDGSKGQVPRWVGRQKITVTENDDNTVDITITNV